MVRMTGQHQRFLAQRDNLPALVVFRVGYQAHIHRVTEHVVIDLVGPAVFDMDLHLGIFPHEAFDVRGQIVQADAINGRHPDFAGDDVPDLLHAVVDGVVSLEDLLAVGVKRFRLRW